MNVFLRCGIRASMAGVLLLLGGTAAFTVASAAFRTDSASATVSCGIGSTPLISGLQGPGGIVVSGSDLFIANEVSDTVGEHTTSGAPVNASLISGLNDPAPLAVSGSDLCVVSYIDGILGEYTTSGAPVDESLVSDLADPQSIAVSGSDVFVARENVVGEYTTSGATANPSLICGLNGPIGIAVAGSNLFVINNGSGTVGKYTTSGATVDASFVSGLTNPQAVAVSGSDLFETNEAGTVGKFDIASGVELPAATCTTTSLSDLNGSGSEVSVPSGTGVVGSTTISGQNASAATGAVTYVVYSDSDCTKSVYEGTPKPITTPGALPASDSVTLAVPGYYYWQASYSGDDNNAASVSACGAVSDGGEVETITGVDSVTFDSDGGVLVGPVSGPDYSSINLPSDTYSGYSLAGWFTEWGSRSRRSRGALHHA